MIRVLLLGGLLLSVSACGESGEQFYPVEGKVLLEGQPLPRGAVALRPDAERGNTSHHHPIGEIGPDGAFTVRTIGRAGAPPGWYKVLIIAHEPVEQPVEPVWLTHARYRDERTTPFAVEVGPQPKPDAYTFELTR
jgi:hypothetical protein